MGSKQKILLISFIIITSIILVSLMLFSIFNRQAQVPSAPDKFLLTPTIFEASPLPTTKKIPPVRYQKKGFYRLLEIITSRPLLSDNDSSIRKDVLASLGNKSGLLYESSLVRIEYIKTPDIFEGEILTINIESAKSQGVQWFLSKGMSKEGVCNLPLSFYLNYNVTQQLRGKNFEFNTLPEGC